MPNLESDVLPKANLYIGDVIHSQRIPLGPTDHKDIPAFSGTLMLYDVVNVDRTGLPNNMKLTLRLQNHPATVKINLIDLMRLNHGRLVVDCCTSNHYNDRGPRQVLTMLDQFSTSIG